MTKSLRRLTLFALLCVVLPVAVQAQQKAQLPSGAMLVDKVLAQLERQQSIKANLLVRGMLGDRILTCDDPGNPGTYYQLWDTSREKLSVRLQVQGFIEDTPVSFLQVSNGDRLWTDSRLPSGRRVTDVDLRQIRRHGKIAEQQSIRTPVGAATVIPMQTELSAEQGGLPALVASLKENFIFSPAVKLELSNVSVLGTIGHWRQGKLAHLFRGEGEDTLSEVSSLPEHIPATVLLVVGSDDYFPYIVEFRRDHGQFTPPPTDMAAYQLQSDPLMFLHLYQRELGTPIPKAEFQYVRDDAESVDLTAQRLKRLQRIKKKRVAALRPAGGRG